MNFICPLTDKEHESEVNYCSFQSKVYPCVNLRASSYEHNVTRCICKQTKLSLILHESFMQSETRFLGSDILPICELKLWQEQKAATALRLSTRHWRSSLVSKLLWRCQNACELFVSDALMPQNFRVRDWVTGKCLIEKPLTYTRDEGLFTCFSADFPEGCCHGMQRDDLTHLCSVFETYIS